MILKGLIYGQPGIGKTTLAISAPRAFIVDVENGLKRVEPQYRALVGKAVINNYAEFLELVKGDQLNNYDTIVIDTAGRMVDKINDWLAVSNPKQKKGDGSPSMQGWGAIKLQFQNLFKLLDSKNKSVIFVAHEKEEKNGEATIKRPDIAGSSGKELVKDLDFMGYMFKSANKTIVDFIPSEAYYAKNSMGLDDFLEVPKIKGINNFLEKNLFEKAETKFANDSDIEEKFNSLINIITGNIEALENIEQVNEFYKNSYQKLEQIWSSREVEQQLLAEKVKKLELVFDKAKKEFVDPNLKIEPAKENDK